MDGKKLLPGSFLTAEFADGVVSGSSGCNLYSGSYKARALGGISISSTLASTRKACRQAVMAQETAYLKALSSVDRYSTRGSGLALRSNGKVVLQFTAQSQALTGTRWLVTGYNNGKQAVVSPIAETRLTAAFSKDGKLSGSGGCNSYSGPFTQSGTSIKIGPLASTRKACETPAGTMEQEQQFLAALTSTATSKLSGGTLELRTQNGALAVELQRA